MKSREIALRCARRAYAKKAGAVQVLDVSRLTSVCSYFVVVSGRSEVHVKTIAEAIAKELKKEHIYPLHREGWNPGQWVLLDYGGVVVHVFKKSVREFYMIENLWADARPVNWQKTKKDKK